VDYWLYRFIDSIFSGAFKILNVDAYCFKENARQGSKIKGSTKIRQFGDAGRWVLVPPCF
jgi:hypothetical protein